MPKMLQYLLFLNNKKHLINCHSLSNSLCFLPRKLSPLCLNADHSYLTGIYGCYYCLLHPSFARYTNH